MATSANKGSRHPELVQRPRERRPFTQLQPRQGGALPAEAARGLPRLRLSVEPQLPAVVRGLVTIAAHASSFGDGRAVEIGALNRRRRAATAWLRAILDGAVDAATLSEVADAYLPVLIGSRAGVRVRAPICIEYVRGVMTALVLTRPEDNLVPEARSLFALETVLSLHLGAVMQSAAGSPAASQPRTARGAKVPV